MKKQQGFTFIELMMVVLMLGILAATVMPRLADFSNLSKNAALMGLLGGLRSAIMLSRTTCIISPHCDENAETGSKITLEDVDVDMTYGYPTNAETGIISTVVLQGIASEVLLDQVDPTMVLGVRFLLDEMEDCSITYVAPTAAGSAPVLTVNDNGCHSSVFAPGQ